MTVNLDGCNIVGASVLLGGVSAPRVRIGEPGFRFFPRPCARSYHAERTV